MAQNPQPASAPRTRPPRLGAGLAYALAALALVLGTALAWAALEGCGLRLMGTTWRLPWCAPPVAQIDTLRAAQARNAVLRDQVHQAEMSLRTPDACGPRVVLPPEPIDEAAAPPDPAPPEVACAPGQRPAPPPSRVALIVDASGSMDYSVDVPEALEAQYLRDEAALRAMRNRIPANPFEALGYLNQIASRDAALSRLNDRIESVPGRSRMSVAQEALAEVVATVPDALAIDLTSFTNCDDIAANTYAPARRSAALDRIRSLRPDGGTPIAAAMTRAAAEIPATAESAINILLVTDGNDSCGGDPCATARRLKRERPNFVVNVIDLSQTDALRCVSDATGGTYQRTRGADVIEFRAIAESGLHYEEAELCRPSP